MDINLKSGHWLNEPTVHEVTGESIVMVTDPQTDFWQRSYYGFQNDNGSAWLFESGANFTFTARVTFEYQLQYDQCGLIIYLDSDNWFKASIEHETVTYARLGSVVTNHGYSDWATSDIDPVTFIWYRLSRRGPDFLLESSFDGASFNQMRIFHLHALGATTADMGRRTPPLPAEQSLRFGVYACSPLEASFRAEFSQIKLEPCQWAAHG